MKPIFLVPPIESVPYCWIFNVGFNRLGVHQHDGWCIEIGERIVLIDSEDKCVLLESILEIEQESLFSFLKDVVQQYPAFTDSIEKFPKAMLFKHVFHNSVSGYWPEKALVWLESDPSLAANFHDELEKFSKNKVMPQAARQKAKKVLQGLRLTPDQIIARVT